MSFRSLFAFSSNNGSYKSSLYLFQTLPNGIYIGYTLNIEGTVYLGIMHTNDNCLVNIRAL